MDTRDNIEDGEFLARYLVEMERPRPFRTARIILARGAVKWFLNLPVGIPVVGLLVLAAASVGGSSTGGASLIAVVVIFGFLGYVVYRLFQRIMEPFLWTRLLRDGEVMVLPVVKRTGTAGVFSKFGVKSRTAYTLRYGDGPEAPALEAVFDGSFKYQGDTCVVLYEAGAEAGSEAVPPKRFFALDCFLFHRLLTFPDLLEGTEQELARTALGYDESWRSSLGSTAGQLFNRFMIAMSLVIAILGILFVILRTGI